ncbi:unnamed protein product [Adineta steineri]|uniref:Beta-lactamase-related domain-containing protein n=1 Tax=Adineta steineri TaxID=433720 RepID=A0A813Q573_9BILA|nr:unnamed protein product [Adineta steineri]CAF3525048.1 unnamed protein product [Adineta steineri]
MLHLWSTIVILLFTIVGTGSRTCPNKKSIEEALIQAHIPGAAIIVVNTTHSLYEQAFGYQSLSPQIPMDLDNSIFALASISKPFVATAVMQLVEKELVDLDTDINVYLSEPNRKIFHPGYPLHSITLRKLLSHSASIAPTDRSSPDFYQPGDQEFLQMSLADKLFAYLQPNASNWLPKPPGSVTDYSNEGAALAALVVERVAQIPFDQYVKENILKPLGINLHKAGYYLSDFEDKEVLVKHYLYANNQSVLKYAQSVAPLLNITYDSNTYPGWINIRFYSSNEYPAGYLHMSARCLSLFLRMFMSNGSSILSPRSVAEMRLVVGGGLIPDYDHIVNENSTDLPIPDQFTVGWYWETTAEGQRLLGHSGTLPGAKNLMLMNEKNTLGVIFLSNNNNLTGIYMSRKNLGTIEKICLSLIQCFENSASHSSIFNRALPSLLDDTSSHKKLDL